MVLDESVCLWMNLCLIVDRPILLHHVPITKTLLHTDYTSSTMFAFILITELHSNNYIHNRNVTYDENP